MIHLLAERGILVRLDQRSFIHRDALEAAKQAALGLFARKPSFSTMEFRDALAVSRKYAVPLLDYLDKNPLHRPLGARPHAGGGGEERDLEMKLQTLAKRRRVMERSQRLGHCICDPRRPCPCDVFETSRFALAPGNGPTRLIFPSFSSPGS